ncbi:hypothetical protein [Floridanema evergladense]|uniref:Uncharacterized protein n=1 Tax=Floridaenema evergladense BLCC-F167 TaxID=3153639 RepID=A0ABV4WN54_9CYAN
MSLESFAERLQWSLILALAWKELDILKDLRKNPKETIIQIAEGKDGKYGRVVDDRTEDAAKAIKKQAEADPEDDYTGYLPIPQPRGLNKLNVEELEELLENGITGILKCNKNADLWAKALHKAWQDDLLIDIRRDPLNHLPFVDELLNTEYGIFPIPDPPESLRELSFENLEGLFSDEDNMSHLGGIFLFGS